MEEVTSFFDNLKNVTRYSAAKMYRRLLLENELGNRPDYSDINRKIIARWSKSALVYIKEKAWIEPLSNNPRRTWTTGVDGATGKIDAFLVSRNSCNEICRVGFSDYKSALEHALKIQALRNQ